MSIEPGWYDVDDTGHVPYVAAEMPRNHTIYLDASGNIGAIVALERETPLDEESAPDNDAIPVEQLPPGKAFLVDSTLIEADASSGMLPDAQGKIIDAPMAVGGVIEPGTWAIVGEAGLESAYLPDGSTIQEAHTDATQEQAAITPDAQEEPPVPSVDAPEAIVEQTQETPEAEPFVSAQPDEQSSIQDEQASEQLAASDG